MKELNVFQVLCLELEQEIKELVLERERFRLPKEEKQFDYEFQKQKIESRAFAISRMLNFVKKYNQHLTTLTDLEIKQ